jgi:hypothetical protein
MLRTLSSVNVKYTKEKGGNERETDTVQTFGVGSVSEEPVGIPTLKYEPIYFEIQRSN